MRDATTNTRAGSGRGKEKSCLMPWNSDHTKFLWVPRPELQPLPIGVKESDPEARAQRSREYRAQQYWFERAVVDFIDHWRWCPRTACRRARSCKTANVACHREHGAELREIIYPWLRGESPESIRERMAIKDAARAELARRSGSSR